MEGERLPQVMMEMEGKTGRGRKKNIKERKDWSQVEELRGCWRTQSKRYIMNIGQKWIKFKRKGYWWVRYLAVLNISTAEKKGRKGWGAMNTVLSISWLISLYMFVHI